MSINTLQFRKMKFNSEFTDQNSLANALLTKPEISNSLVYAFGDKFHLNYLTAGSGRVSENYKQTGNEEIMWPLMGQLTKSVQIVGDSTPAAATGAVGRGFLPFTVPVEDKYFALGDKVKFKSGAVARVQEEPKQRPGGGWNLTLVIFSHDFNAFIPATDLTVGSNIGWAGTSFEEFSKGGSSKNAKPMWFKNQMTTSRIKWGMSGGARTDVMVLEMKTESGKSALWMYQEEYQQMLHWQRITEIDRWYSVYNRTPQGTVEMPGSNGRPVKSGAGLIQQLEGTNYREYTDLNEDFIRDFLTDLQIQSKDAENSHYMVFTGATGKDLFDKAMKDSRQNYNIVDTHFVSKHEGDLKFGNNFTSYKGLLGSVVTLVYVPLFDDATLHTDIDEETGRPYESGRMVFLDFADFEGEANISLCAKGADGIDRSFLRWCNDGATTYEGASSMKRLMRSSDVDGFEVNYLSETLLKVINPLSCGMLVKKRV
jgi:hypothetical protein